jgi:hypothetical protein
MAVVDVSCNLGKIRLINKFKVVYFFVVIILLLLLD